MCTAITANVIVWWTEMCLLIPIECQVPGADLEINPTLESLCLSMTEHALGGECPQQTHAY